MPAHQLAECLLHRRGERDRQLAITAVCPPKDGCGQFVREAFRREAQLRHTCTQYFQFPLLSTEQNFTQTRKFRVGV